MKKVLLMVIILNILLMVTKVSLDSKPLGKEHLSPGPQTSAILMGEKLLSETWRLLPQYVGNKLACTNCHLNGGTMSLSAPWIGVWGVFPEYRLRAGKLISLEERINACFQRSLNGKPLPYNSEEMLAILAYMQWLSHGVPTNESFEGRGFGPIDSRWREMKT